MLAMDLSDPTAWGWRTDPLTALPYLWLELLAVFIIFSFVIWSQKGNRTPRGNVFPGDYCLQLVAL